MADKVSYPVNLPASFIQQSLTGIQGALRNIFQSVSLEMSDHARRLNSALIPDGTEGFRSFTVATLPSASAGARAIIYVSDETGGATMAFSDGTNWRRFSDRNVVS